MRFFSFNTKNNGFLATAIKKEYENFEIEKIYQMFNKNKNDFIKINFDEQFDDIYTFTNKEDLIDFFKTENIDEAFFKIKDFIYYWDNENQEVYNLEDIVAKRNIKKINEEHFYLINDEKINNKLEKWFNSTDMISLSKTTQIIFDECKADLHHNIYEVFPYSILMIGDKLAYLSKNLSNQTNIQILNENLLPKDLKDELNFINFNQKKPEEILANLNNYLEAEKDQITNSKNRKLLKNFYEIKNNKLDKLIESIDLATKEMKQTSLFDEEEIKPTYKPNSNYQNREDLIAKKRNKR